jgi:hypothetical protein
MGNTRNGADSLMLLVKAKNPSRPTTKAGLCVGWEHKEVTGMIR